MWVYIRAVITIHKVSDFKPSPGKILDAAKTTPQYVVRHGVLLVIQRLDRIHRQQAAGVSAWDALGGSAGTNVELPNMPGTVREVRL